MPGDAAKAAKLARLQALIDAVPADAAPAHVDVGEGMAAPQSGRRATRHRLPEGAAEPPAAAAPADDARPARAGARRARAAGDGPRPATAKAAFQRIVDLCGYQDYSRAKMRERLRREGIPDTAAEDALAKAVRIGLIDDMRWGEMRASALMRKGMGNAGIVRELKENGISATDIEGWPQAYEERFGGELERALRFLEKNPPRSKNPRASAYGKLMRKGFASATASEACAIWFSR